MTRSTLLQTFRVTHLYFGVFITPALLFFALTGALQTFGLHETNRDHPNYKPAHWITVLAQIHKKQTDILPARRPQPQPQPQRQPQPQSQSQPGAPAAAPTPGSNQTSHQPSGAEPGRHQRESAATPGLSPAPVPAPAPPPAPAPRNPVPLRIFFLIVCLGLFTSTSTGLYMAYRYNRNKLLVSLTLAAGVVVPLLLLLV